MQSCVAIQQQAAVIVGDKGRIGSVDDFHITTVFLDRRGYTVSCYIEITSAVYSDIIRYASSGNEYPVTG